MTSRPTLRVAAVIAILAACATAVFVQAAAAAQTSKSFEGRPVADVLRQLQAAGAPIIFSSVLVTPDLRVKAEPRKDRGAREIADEILAPHGLALADGPGKSWIVVRRAEPTPRPSPKSQPKSAPKTTPAPSREPGGAEPQSPVRIEEQVLVKERAGDLAASPNAYAVDPIKMLDTAGTLENPFQALPYLPGVAATNDHDGRLAVRGAGPEHNTVVFDGVQIHNPQRMASDLGGNQSFVNPATVANVALDASGLDARYGGRLSSVTLFETRDGMTSRRLAISGSAGLTSGDVIAEGRLPGTISGSWWATMRGTYYRLVADRFKDGDIPSFVDGQFKIAASPSPQTRLSVLGLVGAEALVRPLGGPPEARGANFAGDNLREFHANTRLGIATLQWTPGTRVSTTTTVNVYSNTSRYQDGWIDWKTGLPFERRVAVVDVAVRQRASIAWSPRHVLDVGGEVHRLHSSWDMQSVNLLWRRAPGPDIWGHFIEYDGPISTEIRTTQAGVWAQERVPLPGALVLEPGLRLDWNSFTGETALQPRLRVTRPIGDGAIVWAGAAGQAQTPGYATLQQGLAFYDLGGPGALDVRNERSRQIVGGFELRLPHTMALRVEAYRRTFDRLLVQRQETDLERAERLSQYDIPPDMPPDSAILEHRPLSDPDSTGTGRASGLEILLDRTSGRISGWVGYTISKAERDLFGHPIAFDFDRRHALGVALNAVVSRKVRVSLRSQYASGFPLTPLHPEVLFNDDRNRFPGPPPGTKFRAGRRANGELFLRMDPSDPPRLSLLNSGRMSAYARTDVRVTYTINRHFDVYGEIINVFNRENFLGLEGDVSRVNGEKVEFQSAPAFPRLFTCGVRFNFW